jgi:hypothetical protein
MTSMRHICEQSGQRGTRIDRPYLEFYNSCRPHSSLDRLTPDQAYFEPAAADRSSLNSAGPPIINPEKLFR